MWMNPTYLNILRIPYSRLPLYITISIELVCRSLGRSVGLYVTSLSHQRTAYDDLVDPWAFLTRLSRLISQPNPHAIYHSPRFRERS